MLICFLFTLGSTANSLDGARVFGAQRFHTEVGCLEFWNPRLGNSHFRLVVFSTLFVHFNLKNIRAIAFFTLGYV